MNQPLVLESKDPWSVILAEPSSIKKTWLWLANYALSPLIQGFTRGVAHLFTLSYLLYLY